MIPTGLPALVAQQQAQPNPMGMMVPILLMAVMFYFGIIRPQNKRQKELQKQIDAMKVGDSVVTVGGMHGLVANKGEKTVTLKVADNVRIKFDVSAIARVQPRSKGEEGTEDTAESAPAKG
jgi:preprotein translocase subunit YajC